ncbi:MAG: HAD-IA family hydrolase [Rhodobacteraceae bacterium]|nr:HAD-IA family hydrolase [Paracoccaceae bacterium]
MGLQALIFDVDGTLAETAEIHRAAFNQAFDEFQIGWRWDRRTYSYLMNMTNDIEMLRGFDRMSARKVRHGVVSDEALRQIALRKMQVYLAMLADGTAYLRPGVSRLIDEARRDHITLGIVSTRPKIEFEMLVTNTLGFEALSLFDSVRTADDCRLAVDAYQLVLADLGVTPRNSVAIDDAESGIRDASACGINTIATPGIYTSSGRFDGAGIVISDLGQPAQPYNIIMGNAEGRGYISAQYLRKIVGETQAAA